MRLKLKNRYELIISESNEMKIANIKNIYQSFIDKYKGFIFAFISSILFSISNMCIKKAKFVSGSDQVCLRLFIQLLSMGIASIAAHLDVLGPVGMRKILILRGLLASTGYLAVAFSIKLIDPSDCVSIMNSSMFITIVAARLFLKEKLSSTHIVSIFVTLAGVFLITQPNFLFQATTTTTVKILNMSNITNNTDSDHKSPNLPGISLSAALKQTLGLVLAICATFVNGFVPIVVKHLSNKKVDFKIIIIYSAYFGLPIALVISALLKALRIDRGHELLFDNSNKLVLVQLSYSIVSAVFSVLGQVCSNVAYNFEDASKIQVVRSLDVLLTFILQHFFLGIDSNIYTIVGAILITSASITVISFRILEKSYYEKKLAKTTAELNNNPSRFLMCIFYKF